MVGRICPLVGIELEIGTTAVVLVAPVYTSLLWLAKLSDMCQKENQTKWLGVYSVNLGWLVCQSSTGNFYNSPTFEGFSFHIFMGKKITKLEFL